MTSLPPIQSFQFHQPSRTLFQLVRRRQNKQTGAVQLLDCLGNAYDLDECQRFQPDIENLPDRYIADGIVAQLYPQKNGFVVQVGKHRQRVHIPDEAERAAQSLAKAFNGQITLTEYL